MTKDTTDASEQEVTGTPLLTPEQLAEWSAEELPFAPKLTDEQGNELREEPDEETTTDVEQDEELPEPAAYVAPVNQLEDPGDYTPADYSFEITVYTGEEGKEKPKTVTVRSVEEAERLLEDDPNFGSAKNLLDFNRKVSKMENNLERDESEWQKKRDTFDEAAESENERQAKFNIVVNELAYLEKKGKLPEVPANLRNANWQDAEVAKDPAVKSQLALIKYMAKENEERATLGLSPMGAIDAFNAMQSEAIEKNRDSSKTKSALERRQASARVARSSPAPVSNVPKGIKVGRAGNLRDIGSDWGI